MFNRYLVGAWLAVHFPERGLAFRRIHVGIT